MTWTGSSLGSGFNLFHFSWKLTPGLSKKLHLVMKFCFLNMNTDNQVPTESLEVKKPYKEILLDFPEASLVAQSVKNPPAMQETACNTGVQSSIPGWGSSSGE